MMPCIIELREWECRDPATEPRLAGVRLENDRARALAQKLADQKMLEVLELADGLRVAACSYVGSVSLGSVRITVRPKIRGETLLRLFRYAYGLRDLRLVDRFTFDVADRLFQDLVISQLAGEVRSLFARGLARRYRHVHEDLPTLAGRVDFKRLAARCEAAVLPCVHHPRLADCLVNRVVLAGLRFAVPETQDLALKVRLRQLAAALAQEVTPLDLDGGVLARVEREMTRLTAAYEPAIALIRVLYESAGVFGAARERVELPGFLFDMNRFFQALLSRFLRENLPGLQVQDEHRLKGMMAYLPEHNPRGCQAPQPRPDFAILSDVKVVALLDAKYRDLWEHSLPGDMLYQLAMYALSQRHARSAAILYPTDRSEARDAVIEVRDPLQGRAGAWVVLRPVNLPCLERLLVGEDPQARRRREAYAKWLALGSSGQHSSPAGACGCRPECRE